MSGLSFNPNNSRSKRRIRRVIFLLEIVVILALAYVVFYCFGTGDNVNEKAMQPTLNADDTAIINRVGFKVFGIDRYDVIAYERDDQIFYRRVVGLPGETVTIREGSIYVNDEALSSELLPETVTGGGLPAEGMTLGGYEYFVIGDNINSSEDTRSDRVGSIQQSEIIGTVWLRWAGGISFSLVH